MVFPDERGLGEGEGDGPVRKKVRVSDGSEEEEGEEHTGWRRRRRLADLPAGAKVGTSSVRRAAMVRRRYPRLEIADVRGNVGTRLRKLDDQGMGFDAIILAGAGVQRLGLGHRVGEWLDAEEEEEGGEGGGGMLHAVGQGAIGVEIREGDEWVTGLLEGGGGGVSVIRKRVSWECMAERSLLRTLEGGCSVPVGVSCKWEDGKEKAPRNVPHDSAENSGNGTITTDGLRSNEQVSSTLRGGDSADTSRPSSSHTDLLPTSMNPSTLHMRASVTSVDGKECVQGSCRRWIDSDESADMLGWELARSLVEKGAGKILEKITLNRGMIERADGA